MPLETLGLMPRDWPEPTGAEVANRVAPGSARSTQSKLAPNATARQPRYRHRSQPTQGPVPFETLTRR